MCNNCNVLLQLASSSKGELEELDRHYASVAEVLKELVSSAKLEFVAGDCSLEDIEKNHENLEQIVMLRHYFRCECGQTYFLGAFCRGKPKFKRVEKIPDVDYLVPKFWDRKVRKKFGSWKKHK